MSVRIKDTDKGFARLLREVAPLGRGAGLTVGIHAQEGAQAHSSEGGRELTIVEVAAFNEFGLGVPERSFIRAWFDEGKTANHDALRLIVTRIMKGEIKAAEALEQLGLKFVGGVQQRIARGINPPNAPATIARKNSSKPLIDKGQLRQAIVSKLTGKATP